MNTRTGPVMACVTAQMDCKRIIKAASALAEKLGTKVFVVTVQPKNADAVSRAKDMKTLCHLAASAGCEISVRYSDHPAKSVAAAAKESGAIHIFTGTPAGSTDFLGKLGLLLDGVPISVVSHDVYCTFNSLQYS